LGGQQLCVKRCHRVFCQPGVVGCQTTTTLICPYHCVVHPPQFHQKVFHDSRTCRHSHHTWSTRCL
jgi:hypothetical protein